MGYTSGTTMEDRGLRDIERWRDKIEVRLDNRQVFFLFFGSALVACMLFVLGVIVGKRLESRGRAVSPEIEDPLALLDKVATSPRPAQSAVTFPQALFGTNKGSAGDKHAKKTMLSAAPEDETPAHKPPAAATAKTEESSLAPAPATPVAESKPAPTKPTAKPDSKPVAAIVAEKSHEPAPSKAKPAEAQETKPTATPTVAKPAATPAVAKPATTPAVAKPATTPAVAKPATIPTVAASSEGKSKGRFALQLSSFQDKSEAEAFAQKFGGERPYMVVSEIPGKGTWYRVRVGDYASAKDAIAAKQSFEKKHNVIAYVAQK